ncbi:hypothetical protein CLU90_1412 [Janthinobacterium sp. 67]|nr:hypothetical protein CLU90_1412 [Janthinobacterium sp. 67]
MDAHMKNGAHQDIVPVRPVGRLAGSAYRAVTVTGRFSCAVKPLLSSATTFSA